MDELLKILNDNGIKYKFSTYAGYDSIVIRNNKYQIEIFEDEMGFASDLQKVPYTWGRMGVTTLSGILKDLNDYLNIKILSSQLSLF